MTADRRALTLNIDEVKFLDAVDREGDHEVGAGSASVIARAAFVAMVEAWPGMAHYRGGWEPVIHNNRKPHLTLPLTEKQDD